MWYKLIGIEEKPFDFNGHKGITCFLHFTYEDSIKGSGEFTLKKKYKGDRLGSDAIGLSYLLYYDAYGNVVKLEEV